MAPKKLSSSKFFKFIYGVKEDKNELDAERRFFWKNWIFREKWVMEKNWGALHKIIVIEYRKKLCGEKVRRNYDPEKGPLKSSFLRNFFVLFMLWMCFMLEEDASGKIMFLKKRECRKRSWVLKYIRKLLGGEGYRKCVPKEDCLLSEGGGSSQIGLI